MICDIMATLIKYAFTINFYIKLAHAIKIFVDESLKIPK